MRFSRTASSLAITSALGLAAFHGLGCATPAATTTTSSSTLGAAAQKWADAKQPASFVSFFAGTFTRLGLTITETGEQFTVVHQGDRFTFEPGADNVDFIVPIGMRNVDSMVSRASDGALDEKDAYGIMAGLFTPLTREILKHPVSADNTLRQLSGVEDRIHVVLLDADGNEGASHTLVYAGGAWDVLAGQQGAAQRTFRMTAAQALDYQRHAYEAMRANNPVGWTAFGTWYNTWRETCSKASSS